MDSLLPTEAAFLKATVEAFPDGFALDITRVLNLLCPDACGASPERVIAHIDLLMDELYRRRLLACPGHRWLLEPVDSIAGHLVALFAQRFITWSEAGWAFQQVTSIYTIREAT